MQNPEKASHDRIRLLEAFARVEVFHDHDPVISKDSVSLMIMHRSGWRMEWLSINLEDRPAAVLADEEVWFPITPVICGDAKACHAVREERALLRGRVPARF